VAGDTLLVAFFTREAAPGVPSISGGGLEWVSDVSFSTVATTNARHISVFRASVDAPLPARTELVIEHPDANATAALGLLLPAEVAPPPAEVPSVSEGQRETAASGTIDTDGSAALCVVAHADAHAFVYAPGWPLIADLEAACGGARQSGGIHVAVRRGPGVLTCEGSFDSLTDWAMAIVGYQGMPGS
jgi:hypothetical protein